MQSANPSGNTRGQYGFAQVPTAEIQRSVFNRSHGHKTTFDGGWLVPVFVDDVLPGDTVGMQMNVLARLATPLFPVMDNMYLDWFWFWCPNRIVWANWKKFCGEQFDPGDSTDFVTPTLTARSATEGSLDDYFGIPTGVSLTPNALPYRVYYHIWNQWFRDENVSDSKVFSFVDGPDATAYELLKRGKRHDYFTSALPFAQKGDAVELELVGTGVPTFDVSGVSERALAFSSGIGQALWSAPGGGASPPTTSGNVNWADPQLAVQINAMREAFQVQRLLERDARGGTRYTEIIRSHFGVVSPDLRLQRPEFIAGGSTRINVQTVPSQTNESANNLGRLGGFGIGHSQGRSFVKSFTEHGMLMCLVSLRADLTYQQGLERMWSRETRYDYYWPALAHLGEQEILNKEIYADGSANDDLVFGFQERYAEYRYKPSRVSGAFRSAAATPLDSWHLALDFASLPALNETFMLENPPIDRVIQVPSEPHCIADFWFEYRHARPMPTFSVPGMVDHF